MNFALWCVMLVVLLPYLIASYGAYYRGKYCGGLDNKNPRLQIAGLDGAAGRIYAAQQNAWENVALFTATVCVVHLAGLSPDRMVFPCAIFVLCRLVHVFVYINDYNVLRSIANTTGLFCCTALAIMAA